MPSRARRSLNFDHFDTKLRFWLLGVRMCLHAGANPSKPLSTLKRMVMQAAAACFIILLTFSKLPSSAQTARYSRLGLQLHRSDAEFCDQHFGEAWLLNWNATARTLCHAQHPAGDTFLRCRYDTSCMTAAHFSHLMYSVYRDTAVMTQNQYAHARQPLWLSDTVC